MVVRLVLAGPPCVGKSTVLAYFHNLGLHEPTTVVAPSSGHVFFTPFAVVEEVVGEVTEASLAGVDGLVVVRCNEDEQRRRWKELGQTGNPRPLVSEWVIPNVPSGVEVFEVDTSHTWSMSPTRAKVTQILRYLIQTRPKQWEEWLQNQQQMTSALLPSPPNLPSRLEAIHTQNPSTPLARFVLFDLDDTLWETWPPIQKARDEMMTAIAQLLPNVHSALENPQTLLKRMEEFNAREPDLSHDITLGREAVLRELSEVHGDPVENVSIVMETFLKHRSKVEPYLFDDTLEVLHLLKAEGYALGALTNGNTDITHAPSIAPLLDFCLSATDIGAAKPCPTSFLAAASRIGLPLSRIVMVGDNYENDFQGALSLGMPAVWIDRKSESDVPLHGRLDKENILGDRPLRAVISSLRELPSVLKEWEGAT